MGEQPLWYQHNPARLILEKEAMSRRFPQFSLVLQGTKLYWTGALTSNEGNHYEIALEYPDNFPDAPPKIFPIEPEIAIWKDDNMLKHQYRDGSLCLFHPDDRFFEPNTTAVTVIAAAATWLFAYEHWLASGKTEWLGKEAD